MDGYVTEFLQPALIALLVILVPATGRWAVKRIATKLDEGREMATANRVEMTHALDEHRGIVMGELGAIKAQTTQTNGKVAEHDKELVKLAARTDVLMEIYLKGKAE